MSISEKDLILARREGFAAAYSDAVRCGVITEARAKELAAKKYPLPEDSIDMKRGVAICTHCDDCDRPELCDVIKRGTGPCGRNAGMAPAACKVIEELRAEKKLPTVGDVIDYARRTFAPLRAGVADKIMQAIENDGAGEAGGLLNTDYNNKRAYLGDLLATTPEIFGLSPSPWPRDPRANTESSPEHLTKTREVL